ncbi:MAG: hypothetical protein ACRCWB_11635 [Enterovibrio sp.]
MSNAIMSNAIEFIDAIASNMAEVKKPVAAIKDVLEDGEALMHLGVTDEDQELVETAHEIVCGWIDEGREFL